MYKCECGKEFDNAQKFNAHKRHCKIHLAVVGKSYINELNSDKAKFTKAKNRQLKKELAKEQWISEKHMCEHCGKIMTEKFGSGRFCCSACAHVRQPSKKSIDALRLNRLGTEVVHQNALNKYLEHPKYCVVCGKQLPYELRKRKVCSKECLHTQMHDRAVATASKQHNNKKQYKWGTYAGIACDSSWELAYVVYCTDHHVDIKRNFTGFKYIYNGEEHLYYPDFIVNNTYIEIKNYWTEQVQAKINYFPKNLNYLILYKKDLTSILNYCKSKYGTNFADILYNQST